jgi:hypothetical protein
VSASDYSYSRVEAVPVPVPVTQHSHLVTVQAFTLYFTHFSTSSSLYSIFPGLNRPLLNVYPLDLGASEAQQATINLVVLLPSTLKIIFGFTSDNFPIAGYRRKPYMFIGWVITVLIMTAMHFWTDLSMSYEYNTDSVSGHVHVHAVPPPGAPSMEWLSLSFFIFGIGLWLADVMGDSIVVSLSDCFSLIWLPLNANTTAFTLYHYFLLLQSNTHVGLLCDECNAGGKGSIGTRRVQGTSPSNVLCLSLLWDHGGSASCHIFLQLLWPWFYCQSLGIGSPLHVSLDLSFKGASQSSNPIYKGPIARNLDYHQQSSCLATRGIHLLVQSPSSSKSCLEAIPIDRLGIYHCRAQFLIGRIVHVSVCWYSLLQVLLFESKLASHLPSLHPS